MAILHSFGEPVISQQEIETLIGFNNQVRHLKKVRNRLSSDLIERLLAGCKVEQGTHSAELKVQQKGARRVTDLLVYVVVFCFLAPPLRAAPDAAVGPDPVVGASLVGVFLVVGLFLALLPLILLAVIANRVGKTNHLLEILLATRPALPCAPASSSSDAVATEAPSFSMLR
jgi:hypothetical protein